jgi:hypothetical protein
MQPVLVEWRDSMAVAGWHNVTDAKAAQLTTVRSVGFLVKTDRASIVLAQSLGDETGDVGEVVTIPRGAVTSVKPLTAA